MFYQPILAVYEAGNDKGYYIVACCVDHGCGRINKVADGDQNGECKLHLGGEEQRSEDILTDISAAGNTGHTDRGQNSY